MAAPGLTDGIGLQAEVRYTLRNTTHCMALNVCNSIGGKNT